MKAYFESCGEALEALNTTRDGLTEDEAAKRLARHGKNVLEKGKKTPLAKRFLKELRDPMILILLAAATVSGVTALYAGESFADVIIILAVVVVNAVLGVVQESKAEAAIEALEQMAASTSRVVRSGKVLTLRSEEIVPGDIVLLEAGDAVPADGRIVESVSLKIEEAALTGESVPVSKSAEALTKSDSDVPLGDRKNMAYMGSTVVYGRGAMAVTATGMETEMGKIAGILAQDGDEATPLQKRLAQLSRMLSVLVLGVCAVIFAVGVYRASAAPQGVTGAALLDTFMAAVSLAVAAIPEGLAAVVTIVLSIGVTNMSRKNAIIRRLTAVETLGCTQVICSDKTGTLTQNRMTVVERAAQDEKRLITAMALCCDARYDEETGEAVGEPTECALVNDAAKEGLKGDVLAGAYPRVGEAPFDSARKMMTTLHRTEDGVVQFTKGAPDVVLERCTHALTDGGVVEMTDALRREILAQNKRMADRALRVLCAAQRRWDRLPDSLEPDRIERELTYIGLSGMMDPVRPEAKRAIAACREAGVRPVMITGDHRDTAVAIAAELGILNDASQAMTGTEIDGLSDAQLAQSVGRYAVYARVQPEHKVRIVEAWRANGKITAMTGDGVNDAPSIKRADIGVGMGVTGTDVTKNVADMVLADDNFATIVSAVEEGRRIYANIRKAIQFLLASNLSEVLSIFIATLMGFTILEPVHLLWINLVTDCFPALALGMERSEPESMKRPPRDPKEGIFAGGMALDVVLEGAIVTGLVLFAFAAGARLAGDEWRLADSHAGTTAAFLTLSLVEIFHALNMRSRRGSIFRLGTHNAFLYGAMALSFVLTVLVIEVPFLAAAFGFAPVGFREYAAAIGIAVLIIPIMETIKALHRALDKKMDL